MDLKNQGFVSNTYYKDIVKPFILELSKDKDTFHRLIALLSVYPYICKDKDLNSCKFEYEVTDYLNQKSKWTVLDFERIKIVVGESDEKGRFYNYFFDKYTGYTVRFGNTIKDDPLMCNLGPEILDIEISVNGCPKVGGHNCKFCYKNNSDSPATNMTIDQFKTIIDKFPRNLSQIAIGITGVQTNPDFVKILEYTRSRGIIPNYTLSGADLDDYLAKKTVELCGACAVSCYEGNKQLCYDTIKKLHKLKSENFAINMHIVLSEGTLNHIWDVLNDIKNKKVEGLANIVFLHIKPVGRGKIFNCHVKKSDLSKLVSFCIENDIGFGFDSCTAPGVIDTLTDIGKSEYVNMCEPCESSKFSSYINVSGEYWHCSFCEKKEGFQPINILNLDVPFYDMWNRDTRILDMRYPKNPVCRSCQAFDIEFTKG